MFRTRRDCVIVIFYTGYLSLYSSERSVGSLLSSGDDGAQITRRVSMRGEPVRDLVDCVSPLAAESMEANDFLNCLAGR